MCEICICGTHHCPPTPRHLAAHNEEEAAAHNPLARCLPTAPGVCSSTARLPLLPLPSILAASSVAAVAMWTSSSRSRDSVQQPAAIIQSPPMFDTDAALQRTTEANSRYVRHTAVRPHLHRPISAFVSAGELLTTTSSYTAAYINHPSSAPQSCAPPSHSHSTTQRTGAGRRATRRITLASQWSGAQLFVRYRPPLPRRKRRTAERCQRVSCRLHSTQHSARHRLPTSACQPHRR